MDSVLLRGYILNRRKKTKSLCSPFQRHYDCSGVKKKHCSVSLQLRREFMMSNTQTLRGLTTINYWAADLEAAKQWYAELLGIEPYFHVPGYYEFRIGDYQHELG